MNPPHS